MLWRFLIVVAVVAGLVQMWASALSLVLHALWALLLAVAASLLALLLWRGGKGR